MRNSRAAISAEDSLDLEFYHSFICVVHLTRSARALGRPQDAEYSLFEEEDDSLCKATSMAL